jgi:hypothetical protein
MIERLEGMPTGTVGLRGSGKLSLNDYRDVLEPALKEGIDSGEMRLVFALEDFQGLEAGAWVEDAKTGLGTWARHHNAWKRFAFVTDIEWIAKSMRVFSWMAPGEVEVFGLDRLEEAKAWVAG